MQYLDHEVSQDHGIRKRASVAIRLFQLATISFASELPGILSQTAFQQVTGFEKDGVANHRKGCVHLL